MTVDKDTDLFYRPFLSDFCKNQKWNYHTMALAFLNTWQTFKNESFAHMQKPSIENNQIKSKKIWCIGEKFHVNITKGFWSYKKK